MSYDIFSQQRLLQLLRKLDDLLGDYVKAAGGDLSSAVTTFTTADTKTALASGDRLGVTLGKIDKWLQDLHKVAYSGEYKDLKNALGLDVTLAVSGAAADAKITGDRLLAISTQIANLITAIESGMSTDASVELIDIRNGYDGTTHASAGNAVRAIGDELTALRSSLQDYIDQSAVTGLYYDSTSYQLYLTDANGDTIGDPVTIVSGSGGGGGGNQYTITLQNLLDSRNITTSEGMPAVISFKYTSLDDTETDDGAGVATITVNGVKAATFSVEQGNISKDISQYLTVGDNTVRLRVDNSEGSYRTLTYTITVITLSISTTFNSMSTVSGAVGFQYTVVGAGAKTVHFLIDGSEIGTEVVESSGRSRTYNIAAQTPGAHTLKVYAELVSGEITLISNTLVIGFIWISDAMTNPAILSTFAGTTAIQGTNLTIPYMVYDPLTESASVVLSVICGGVTYSTKTLTVDRTAQEWVCQDYPVGSVTFRLQCGVTVLDIVVAVSASDVLVDAVTDGLVFHFDPTGRNNAEENPAQWTNGTVSAAFTDIGFTAADGWQTDEDGASVLRILPGGEVAIPYKPFATDARSTGLTIECEIATHNVRNYDTVVLSCLSDGRGFKIASQYAELISEQTDLSMQFKEDEKVRVSFVVEPRTINRMIYIYIDGILCRAIQYPDNDNFQQAVATGLTIGAEASGIDIYRIRIYGKSLNRAEMLDNFIADRGNLTEKIEMAERNDIFNTAGDIVATKLPVTLPYMIISCPELPQFKGDKKNCTVTFVNQAEPARSYTAEGVQIDVQGTSSAGYKKKNFKIKLKNGLTYTQSGEEAEQYKLREDSIPASVFCLKADVASSEGANNVELVRLYNDIVPHKSPAQVTDERVRVGIDGVPIVVFWQNTTTGVTRFWGIV